MTPYLKKLKIKQYKLPIIDEEITYDTKKIYNKVEVDAAQEVLNYFKINYNSLEKLNAKFQEYKNAKDKDKEEIKGDIFKLLQINKESCEEKAARISSSKQVELIQDLSRELYLDIENNSLNLDDNNFNKDSKDLFEYFCKKIYKAPKILNINIKKLDHSQIYNALKVVLLADDQVMIKLHLREVKDSKDNLSKLLDFFTKSQQIKYISIFNSFGSRDIEELMCEKGYILKKQNIKAAKDEEMLSIYNAAGSKFEIVLHRSNDPTISPQCPKATKVTMQKISLYPAK